MEELKLEKLNISTASENLKNFDFKELLELHLSGSNIPKKKDLKFEKCIFRKGIKFNLETLAYDITELNISFIDCIIEDNKIEQKVNSDTINQSLNILFLSCCIDGLVFKKTTIKSLLFSKSIFLSRLLIENTEINAITIRNCLGKVFLIDNPNTKISIPYSDDNLYIEDNHLRKINREIIKKYKLKRIFQFKTYFQISDAKEINSTFLKQKGSELKITTAEKQKESKYYFTKSDLNLIDISISIESGNESIKKIVIDKGIFNSITLKGDFDSVIDIKHTKTNRLFIENFSSKNFRLYDFSSRLGNSKLEIKNSDLNNVWLDKVQLKSFNRVSFYRTTLENAKFSAVEFPKNIEALANIHYPDKKEGNYFENQYENYKQLKIALSKQNNQIQALQMHSKMYESIMQGKDLSPQDKFILTLNNISNKHGTSIIHAFSLFLIALFIIFITYNMFLPEAPYYIGWISFDDFILTIKRTSGFLIENWKNGFILANPTHRINSLIENNGELSFGNYTISFLSRIIFGWSIYQFITAFRKFGKSL
jgi:hypothetical protein